MKGAPRGEGSVATLSKCYAAGEKEQHQCRKKDFLHGTSGITPNPIRITAIDRDSTHSGALDTSDYEYVEKLAKAGFEKIDIEPTRVYHIDDARAFLSSHHDTLGERLGDEGAASGK